MNVRLKSLINTMMDISSKTVFFSFSECYKMVIYKISFSWWVSRQNNVVCLHIENLSNIRNSVPKRTHTLFYLSNLARVCSNSWSGNDMSNSFFWSISSIRLWLLSFFMQIHLIHKCTRDITKNNRVAAGHRVIMILFYLLNSELGKNSTTI